MNTPTERILAALEQRDLRPTRNGSGWSARCPAHEDRRASLSISEGDDGRALVHCHAGCDTNSICEAVGMRLAELMPSDPPTSTKPRQSAGNGRFRRQQAEKPARNRFPTADAAVASLERKLGPQSADWTYHDAHGKPIGLIARWDTDNGKDIRPVALDGGEWIIGGMPEPRPLYCLPDLADAEEVYACEGEKAVDAARSIGLVATTSAHGSQSPDKTDWSPLAGKQCVILPDNDEAGEAYADAVEAALAKLKPPATVKRVRLPGLPAKGDIADWVEAHDATDSADLRRQVEALAEQATPVVAKESPTVIEIYRPFPTHALPVAICRFVEAGAKAIGCDPSFLALPMLSVLAAAIGNSRSIRSKGGWNAPAILWTAIVGESGTAKTPAFGLVMRPIKNRQGKALAEYNAASAEFEEQRMIYERDLAAWKKIKNSDEPPPVKPDPPVAERFVVSDTTVEALAPMLLANPRGLLMSRDELAGWFGSFDKYAKSGKGGADAAHWLSMFNGESVIVDRKTGHPRTIYVPRAAMSITGGIQPTILHKALGREHRESGLAARLLLAYPPRRAKQWTEAEIDPQAEAEIASVIDRLYGMQPTTDPDGNECPVVLKLTPDAKRAWVDYYNAHAAEQAELSGDLSAAWSKLEEAAIRLALIVACSQWAASGAETCGPDAVDAERMRAGITLAQWFKHETRRVYALLSESDERREERRLAEWIERKGGNVSAREVQQGRREFETADDADAALDGLVKAGFGRWEQNAPTAQGGRPSRRFVLNSISAVYETPAIPAENVGSVDVDTVVSPETHADDDWGEL